MSPISEKLRKLSAVSSKLNTATDELNESLERIEDELQRAGVGLTVWLDKVFHVTPPEADMFSESGTEQWKLGYTKIGKGWRFAVMRAESIMQTLATPQALATSPRIVRMEASAHIEAVLDRLMAHAEKLLANVEGAKAVTDK